MECRSFRATVLDNSRIIIDLEDADADRTMTARETASYLRRSTRCLYSYLRREDDPLPFRQPGGRRSPLVFDRKEVDEWVARQSITPAYPKQ